MNLWISTRTMVETSVPLYSVDLWEVPAVCQKRHQALRRSPLQSRLSLRPHKAWSLQEEQTHDKDGKWSERELWILRREQEVRGKNAPRLHGPSTAWAVRELEVKDGLQSRKTHVRNLTTRKGLWKPWKHKHRWISCLLKSSTSNQRFWLIAK